ncbi:hypothetical protein IV494_01010 [Kaistella sp. G5-32]|uniref:Uncharacterized protein n=1 Tax=Kaistella gelatinilytica TaxID=2787636 RepID=A0ABS0F7U8_9FLAO|nr:hypothetical protein [Kaistella gelatinilytica]MBF8455746.1 hypothetical protein [Kaistella gelatinilytica]
MNNATTSCETKVLQNGGKLYWQYNCNKIWLTLENKKKKIEIDQIDVSDFGLTYRLGFHFIKEYKNSLLFRTGCGANGPCSYILIDKNSGKKLKEFNQLICIDTDIKTENAHPYSFPFVVYLSPETDHLIIYFIDIQKIIKVPFREKLVYAIPENQFTKMEVRNNTLIITYDTSTDILKSLKIDLKDQY